MITSTKHTMICVYISTLMIVMVYISVAISDTAIAMDRFTACVSDINSWMRASRLRLNPSKTQVIWLGSGQLTRQVNICDVPVLSTQVKPVESARDISVIIDSQLSLSVHVAELCRSCYYQLSQLRPEIRSLTSDAAKTLVQAFTTCRLDYCNSLLYGVSNYLMQKVQSVQNAAARLITGTRWCEHNTHHSSSTEVALASCSSEGGVQARVPSLPVVG